jgi:hypothetical protein
MKSDKRKRLTLQVVQLTVYVRGLALRAVEDMDSAYLALGCLSFSDKRNRNFHTLWMNSEFCALTSGRV